MMQEIILNENFTNISHQIIDIFGGCFHRTDNAKLITCSTNLLTSFHFNPNHVASTILHQTLPILPDELVYQTHWTSWNQHIYWLISFWNDMNDWFYNIKSYMYGGYYCAHACSVMCCNLSGFIIIIIQNVWMQSGSNSRCFHSRTKAEFNEPLVHKHC